MSAGSLPIEPLRQMPKQARDVLTAIGASPRLLAHHALVHEAAAELVEGIAAEWPSFAVDRQAVLLGAATHDAGKAVHREEMSGPGRKHEADGPALLVAHGIPEDLARFARTHGQWALEPSPGAEDLLVALANLVWVGERNQRLEDAMILQVAQFSGEPLWNVFARFDSILLSIVEGAGRRLAIYTRVVEDEERIESQLN
jgi:hypothetical protein